MDDDARRAFLTTLPGRLADAIGAAELDAATTPPAGAGIERRREQDELRVGSHLMPSPIPSVLLAFDPPADARWLCGAWGMDRPVAVSDDPHQRSWEILVAGAELPDPSARRIAADRFVAGRWQVGLRLATRPVGGLPDLVSGASPAYDVGERGGEICRLDVRTVAPRADVVVAGHADARSLLDAMAAAYPAWHAGWVVAPGSAFVVLYDDEGPVAGATIEDDGHGTASAGRVCVQSGHGSTVTGSALLDVLEAVALDRGCRALRLDSSAFLAHNEVPLGRHGYVVAPPYDGDGDAAVWAERDLG